ncbi:prim-pol domain-containing protein [Tilletiaria anomala UBC 951]|uniref:DNA primase n=1 Tax=Tilletiaria anomala (strain ATCC 24038 / CBS 436.72 / UBC 951) TaxID=1037660 RepID=A0A066WMK2_TILAU|nr:prim-pol domain-containing protein [Tilletiaria anomala UBC 951]KDN52234.1 prim-pol domain-containing protein [Tilletiaria anomala UBC 951]
MAAAAVAAVAPPYGPARPDPINMEWEGDDEQMDAVMAAFDERAMDQRESTDTMAMLAFYRFLLPWKSLFTWLNHDLVQRPGKLFDHREFAFTLQNDAYLRYNSFGTWQELQKEVVRLNPARFEIGPVYSGKPKDKKNASKNSFRPQFRELVFDIDMTDYDEIRTCCTGKGICKRCWAFIAVAVQVLEDALRNDFGFKHLLWVYSGRRGIHCWVSDRSACSLADDARKAIVGWLEVVRGSANQNKKVDTGAGMPGRSLHPSLRRALGQDGAPGPLSIAFAEVVLRDQDCFRDKQGWERLLALLPPKETEAIQKLRTKWESAGPKGSKSSLEKWQDVMAHAKKKEEVWKPYCEDIILQYTYPRIDAEVSKHLNHLLKSPFVVHPATGRVCVPLDVSSVHVFDPEKDCPTVAQLLREQDAYIRQLKRDGKHHKQDGGIVDPNVHAWDHTSLRPFVELFDKHNAAIVKETDALRRAKLAQSVDF